MNPVRFRVETDKSISSVCFFPGGHGGVATPVPIPNTEVKGSSGEGTAGIARGRVARCQDFFSGEDVVGYPPLFLLCRVIARGGWRGGEPPRANIAWVMCVRFWRDAKPRTAPVARRRDGNIAPYRSSRTGDAARTRRAGGARDAMPHGARRVLRLYEKWLWEWIFCKSD